MCVHYVIKKKLCVLFSYYSNERESYQNCTKLYLLNVCLPEVLLTSFDRIYKIRIKSVLIE